MPKGKIFLVEGAQHSLTELAETAYPKEKELQEYLEEHWDLLPGDQIDPDNPRRWMLVKREMWMPGSKTGDWSVDHLFLDQDGIPTFVECKLAANSEARRKVVAQMLDYAASGTEYWGAGKLRQAANDTASKQKEKYNLDDKVRELCAAPKTQDEDSVIDDYWQTVESNLRSGKVRLIFVTDEAPRELRRLVEFLNSKMADVQCFVVQIKQFCPDTEDRRVLIPTVIVRPPVVPLSPAEGPPRAPLSQEEFIERCKPEAREFFQTVLDDVESQQRPIRWNPLSFSVRTKLPDGRFATFACGWLSGAFQFFFFPELRMPQERLETLKRKLLDFGIFRESGNYTLETDISTLQADGNKETAGRLQAAWHFILESIDEFSRPREAIPSQPS